MSPEHDATDGISIVINIQINIHIGSHTRAGDEQERRKCLDPEINRIRTEGAY